MINKRKKKMNRLLKTCLELTSQVKEDPQNLELYSRLWEVVEEVHTELETEPNCQRKKSLDEVSDKAELALYYSDMLNGIDKDNTIKTTEE